MPTSTNADSRPAGAESAGLLDDYLEDEELAHELKCSIWTLRNWRRLGEAPPSAVIARRRQTRRSVARDWILAREQDPAA